MTKNAGKILWYELMTTDVAAAKAFYSELVGWGSTTFEGSGEYEMMTVGDRPVCGVMPLPEEALGSDASPHFLAYFATADVDETTKKAVAAGAELLVPAMGIPDVGRLSVLRDPQGAVFAPYTPAEDEDLGAAPEVGDISWHELSVADHEKAWDFYHALFGWELTQDMDMGPAGNYRLFMAGPYDGGGMYNKSKEMPAPPGWLYYIRVADLDEACERCKKLGGQVLNGPMEVPGGDRVAQCLDPQGAPFALHQKTKS